jgi:hypothetical protein
MGRPPNIIKRVVVEDCEIVKVSDTSCCRRIGLPFTTVATPEAADACAYSVQGVAAKPSNFTGRRICRFLRAERATISVTPASKSMTCGSTGSSKHPTEKSYAL